VSAQLVLVVEDDHYIREAVREILVDDGFEVACAADGKEAFDLLSKAGLRPSAIVLDMMLPVMSGAELLSHMQNDEELRAIPVIVCAAGEYPQLRGVCQRIRKPFIYRVLLDAVAQVVAAPTGQP
jgi:CheY-like chemotaxis protein